MVPPLLLVAYQGFVQFGLFGVCKFFKSATLLRVVRAGISRSNRLCDWNRFV